MRALALASLLAIGCGGPVFDGPPAVELGTGLTTFAPLTDGDRVTIIMGPQGGYHVWGAARTANLAMPPPGPLHLRRPTGK